MRIQGMITEAFAKLINEHIRHAEEKHPKFADRLVGNVSSYRDDAERMRVLISYMEQDGRVMASALLWEEMYEFLAEVQAGNIEKAKAEAGDVAAVLYRTIKMMEDRQ